MGLMVVVTAMCCDCRFQAPGTWELVEKVFWGVEDEEAFLATSVHF